MKQFNVANLDNSGEYIVHLKGDNGNYDVTYNDGQIVFSNAAFSYNIPSGVGSSIKFQKPDRNTGKVEYIADRVRSLYRDSSSFQSSINNVVNAEPNTSYSTSDITISGLTSPSQVVAPEGVKIYVNSTLTPSGSFVKNGDIVKFEVVSEKTGNTDKKVDLTIGDATHSFSITTKKIPWEVLMHTKSNKGSIGVGQDIFAWAGTMEFRNANPDNTGAKNRLSLGDGQGVYNAFFTKKNITKIALVSGDGSLSNLITHSNYLVYDLVDSTGMESLFDIILRLDMFNRSNPNWALSNTSISTPRVNDWTTGVHGYSGILKAAGGDWRTSGDNQNPEKFVIWGVNKESDNEAQVLCAYSGNLQYGKGANWRGTSPIQTLWSYWGNDWSVNSQTQSIAPTIQSSPGLADNAIGTKSVYLLAY